MKRLLRIGTRGSDLALWQAHHVANLLRAHGHETTIVVLKTRGDLIDDIPLQQVEGKAFFTAEIERALLQQDVDIAVHSHKDLPTEMTPGLCIAAVPPRAAAHERLLMSAGAVDSACAFLPLRQGARVGTSAPRRAEQLRTLRPDLQVLDLRGNVPTRVRKLREGQYDAIVLAAAGLDRLALPMDGLQVRDLDIATFVPSPAQGALAIQVREADHDVWNLCREVLHDEATAADIDAERALLVGAGGGCSLPLAAAIVRDGANYVAHGFLGAQHPAEASHARWARGHAATPRAAIEVVLQSLRSANATSCGPLGGLRIALAGSAQDGSQLGERLQELGATVVQERVIALEDLAGVDLARFLSSARAGDIVALTSRHAAQRLSGVSLADGVRCAAVGNATARELVNGGHSATWIGTHGASELAAVLPLEPSARVYWPCAEEALPDLADALRARKITAHTLPIYRTVACAEIELDTSVDARVYMSPSAVRACLPAERSGIGKRTQRFALGKNTAAALNQAALSAIAPSCSAGPITEALIRELALLHLALRVRTS